MLFLVCYLLEFFVVIKDCFWVNLDRRLDMVVLLNFLVVRLMRKEKEVVEFSKMFKVKEDLFNRWIWEVD